MRRDAGEFFLSFPFKRLNNLCIVDAATASKHEALLFSSTVERCNPVPLLSLKLFLYYRPNKHPTLLYYHCYYHRAITSTSMKCSNQEGPRSCLAR